VVFDPGASLDAHAKYVRRETARKAEEAEREALVRAASFRAEEDECFRLIRSHVERDRLEGYRRHLPLLGRKHGFRIQWHSGSGGKAYWRRRDSWIWTPEIHTDEDAAVGYHEAAHILAGECPNDGTVHRRDMTVRDAWCCVACETHATSLALNLAPFRRSMFDRLARGLRSYRKSTPAAAREIQKLDQLAGTVTFAEHYQKQVRWRDREEWVARGKYEVAQWKREAKRSTR
jgi:hypothetical protein